MKFMYLVASAIGFSAALLGGFSGTPIEAFNIGFAIFSFGIFMSAD
jgi:hypothetical protein